MLLLDVEHKCWSKEMLEICSLREEQMPKLFESYEVIGTISAEAADWLGLPHDVKVVAGAGDNAAAAIGTGTVGEGACNISLGTSGTIFISSRRFGVDPNNALHAFAHADGGWHLMSCMLSAASCNKWLCEEILKTSDFAAEQVDITEDKLGNNPVFFLPYLMGERSPINDTDARGTFIGLSMDSTRSDMVQAVLEGVAFAIRDSFEVAKSLGINIKRSKLCGGGAKSPLWRKMIANVLNIALDIPQTEEGPGYGCAMLAMVGCGAYDSVQSAVDALVHTDHTVEPDPEIAARYEVQYRKFQKIYPAVKELFPAIR
jgi:xylulokinase